MVAYMCDLESPANRIYVQSGIPPNRIYVRSMGMQARRSVAKATFGTQIVQTHILTKTHHHGL
jgi:hypothetical protein